MSPKLRAVKAALITFPLLFGALAFLNFIQSEQLELDIGTVVAFLLAIVGAAYAAYEELKKE